MKKVFNWLIDKWLAGFITASIFFSAKIYADLPEESKANFFKFIWINGLLSKQVTLSKVLIVVIVIIVLTRIEKAILRAKLTSHTSTKLKKPSVPFENYRRDVFGINKTTWIWNYDYNKYDNKFDIVDLKPLCKRCGTAMELREGYHSDMPDCHKCRLDGRPNYDRLTENPPDVYREIIRKITDNEYPVS